MITTDDGVRLWARRTGSGATPLVLCHGGPGIRDTFGELADRLGDRYAVHRWDQRGCGRSEGRDGGAEAYTLARAVADLEAVRRGFGLERMVLLGHSWGAYLALRYALDHPRQVERLVYVSGVGIGPEEEWRPAYAENFLRALGPRRRHWEELAALPDPSPAQERKQCVLRWATDFADPDRALQQAARMATPWYADGIHTAAGRWLGAAKRAEDPAALLARCARLDVETVVVDGALDMRPRSAVDSLVAALPRVRRVTLADAGHMPWEEDWEGFRAAVTG
ncbi:alpha/beta fold hydrolase [Streptomyces sp. NPDC046203]|uniref:alpha/beta fold hydrolase n=1 Tax=Streptomyces sp. NPDC046203 TaxID=3154602 RepID=UPI0033EDCB3B